MSPLYTSRLLFCGPLVAVRCVVPVALMSRSAAEEVQVLVLRSWPLRCGGLARRSPPRAAGAVSLYCGGEKAIPRGVCIASGVPYQRTWITTCPCASAAARWTVRLRSTPKRVLRSCSQPPPSPGSPPAKNLFRSPGHRTLLCGDAVMCKFTAFTIIWLFVSIIVMLIASATEKHFTGRSPPPSGVMRSGSTS